MRSVRTVRQVAAAPTRAAGLFLAALLASLAGCGSGGPAESSRRGAAPAGGGALVGRALPVWVEAAPKTRYYARCHIRTFKDTSGASASGELQGFANVYVIDASGGFKGLLPSPNAQCLVAKLSGPGEVTLHIVKGGDHAVRVGEVRRWSRLNVW